MYNVRHGTGIRHDLKKSKQFAANDGAFVLYINIIDHLEVYKILMNKVCATVLNFYSTKFAILCIDVAEAANPYIDSDNTWTGENY